MTKLSTNSRSRTINTKNRQKMKTMYILMSHKISKYQIEDAMLNWNVTRFITLPTKIWSQIPAERDNIESCLLHLKAQLRDEAKIGDMLLIQGDYGATFNMVQFSNEIGILSVYATSRRISREIIVGETITTIREFKHVKFRKY